MRTVEELEYLNAENDNLKKRIKELEKVVEEKTDAVKYWKNMSVENGHDSWSRY